MATQIVINDPVSQRHIAAPAIAVVSSDANNALRTGSDGNLYVQGAGGGSSQGLVSNEPGNYARYGNDLGVFVGGQEILSNGRTNLLHISDRDGRVELTKEDLEDAGIGGGGSDLKPDVDQLKVDVREIRTDLNTIERQVEKNTNDIATLRPDVTKNTNDIADLKNDIRNITIVSSDRNNVLTVGRDGGAYLNSADIEIKVEDLINPGDPLLTTRNAKLVSGLSMRYNSATGLVELIGVHGTAIASAVIPTALTMLKSINLVDNPAGQPAGTYIHFQFQLSDGSTSDMYLNVNKLAQAYSAGDGIDIDTTGKISVSHDFVEDIADDVIDTELGTRGKITTAIENAIDDITVVSTDLHNVIKKGRDDGAFLSAADIVDVISDEFNVVSKNAGNQLTKGTDGGAMLTKQTVSDIVNDEIDSKKISLVSGDADNLLKAGTDGRPFLDPEDVPSGVSSDINNGLTLGTDNKPFFPLDYGTL